MTSFPRYYYPLLSLKIPSLNFSKGTKDRYISYYINSSYTYKKRYILSLSARKDESNLFGVKANQKGVPLWSAGAGWIISNEKFYHETWLPYLKIRVTNGYNGNVDKSVSAFTTAMVDQANIYNNIYSTIINPPNPSLRWEKVNILNAGIDFASNNSRIEGSIEYYTRKGKDLIGNSVLDPTTGNTQFRGNNSNMKGHGVDIILNTKNVKRSISWSSTILFSQSIDKVTNYRVKQTTITDYLKQEILSPLQGKPLYSIYGLKWMGLDPNNGDPRGLFENKISTDYSSLINSSNFNDLIYRGPANPTFFGSMRNTLTWKQLELSFNITWKAGYYFRRRSIEYYSLYYGNPGHSDFADRWQDMGDEKITNVPSMPYPLNFAVRDEFYRYSEILVEKGDHIRLQDLRASYTINKQEINWLSVRRIQFYIYASNLGILWRANNKNIDPDYVTGIPNPRSYSVGIRVDF